jgi:hypothetical protein
MFHDPHTDVSEARRPTPAQQEVLDLLNLGAAHSPSVRLSLSDWHHVDDMATALAGARTRRAVIPEQRLGTQAAPSVSYI